MRMIVKIVCFWLIKFMIVLVIDLVISDILINFLKIVFNKKIGK